MSDEAVRYLITMATVTTPAMVGIAWAVITWLDRRRQRPPRDAEASALTRYYRGRSEARRAEAEAWDHAYAEAMGWPVTTQERQRAAGLIADGVMGPATVAAFLTPNETRRQMGLTS